MISELFTEYGMYALIAYLVMAMFVAGSIKDDRLMNAINDPPLIVQKTCIAAVWPISVFIYWFFSKDAKW